MTNDELKLTKAQRDWLNRHVRAGGSLDKWPNGKTDDFARREPVPMPSTDLVERLRQRCTRIGDSPEQLLNFMAGILPLLKEAANEIESLRMACVGKDLAAKAYYENYRTEEARTLTIDKTALTAALGDTHVIVPREMTKEMYLAGFHAIENGASCEYDGLCVGHETPDEVYRAMINARPDNAPTSPTIPAFCDPCLHPLSENKP